MNLEEKLEYYIKSVTNAINVDLIILFVNMLTMESDLLLMNFLKHKQLEIKTVGIWLGLVVLQI